MTAVQGGVSNERWSKVFYCNDEFATLKYDSFFVHNIFIFSGNNRVAK